MAKKSDDPDAPEWDIEGPEHDKTEKRLPPRGKSVTISPTKQNWDIDIEAPSWPDPLTPR